MTNTPAVVSQRLPDNRIVNIPIAHGTPTTSAMTTSGRILALTSRLDPIPRSSPTAVPISSALVSSHGRGSGITLLTILRAPAVNRLAARRATPRTTLWAQVLGTHQRLPRRYAFPSSVVVLRGRIRHPSR